MTDASNAHDRQLLLDLFEDLANSEPEPLAEVYPSQNVMHWGCSNVLDTGFTESNAVHMRGQQAAVGNLVYRQQSKKKRIRVREAGQVRALEDQLQLVQKTLQSVSAKNEVSPDSQPACPCFPFAAKA